MTTSDFTAAARDYATTIEVHRPDQRDGVGEFDGGAPGRRHERDDVCLAAGQARFEEGD
jgi:hypothetical protein